MGRGRDKQSAIRVALPRFHRRPKPTRIPEIEEACPPLAPVEKYARVRVNAGDHGVEVILEKRPFVVRVIDGLNSVWTPDVGAWKTVLRETFDSDEVAKATEQGARWKRRAEELAAQEQHTEQAVVATRSLGLIMAERALRGPLADLLGRPGIDYPLYEVDTGYNYNVGFAFATAYQKGGGAVGNSEWLSGKELTWDNLLEEARLADEKAQAMTRQAAEVWADEQTTLAAREPEVQHEQLLARQSADAVRAALDAG